MPMRFLSRLRRRDKREEDGSTGGGGDDDESEQGGVEEKKKRERAAVTGQQPRLYVQCNSMVKEQYAADRRLGKIVYINDDAHPILIDNEHFTGHAVFRVREFDGWTPADPATGRPLSPLHTLPAYFDGRKRAFSIQMSGRFKQAWSGDEVLFGTWFKEPLVLPRGYRVALAFARRIDRSMTYCLEGDQPYMCSPLICAMNVVHFEHAAASSVPKQEHAGDGTAAADDDENQFHREKGWKGLTGSAGISSSNNSSSNASKKNKKARDADAAARELPEWKWFDGRHLEENLLADWPSWPTPPTASFYTSAPAADDAPDTDDSTAAKHRRAWFLDARRRRAFTFHPDIVYSWDFFSPYVDVNRMQLKLGISIDMDYYLQGQPLRYQARSRDGKVVFFEFVVGLA